MFVSLNQAIQVAAINFDKKSTVSHLLNNIRYNFA